MKKLFLMIVGILMALPTLARDFTYTYRGQTLTYIVTSEDPKTVITKIGSYSTPGNNVSGTLIIPEQVNDGTDNYTVTSLGYNAFYGCSGLTSVTIPNSVTEIGGGAFSGCSGMTSVSIPNSVISIGPEAFYNCSGLTSVTIGNSVTEIGGSAFYNCTELTSVTIPNSVTYIGSSAFCNCSGLTSVSIPNSVTSIGEYAFSRCSRLTSVYYQANDPISASDYVFSNTTYQQAKLYVPDVAVAKCKTIDPWMNFTSIEAYDLDGIEAIAADFDDDKPFEVYELNGAKIGNTLEALPAGFYILRQGSAAKKIMIK